MEGDTYHTPAHDQKDLHSRIMQRNLKGIISSDPELEEDLLAYCQDPETSDDMILLTVDEYDPNLGSFLEVWMKKPPSFILDQAIKQEKDGKTEVANILYALADRKKQNYEAMMSEKRTDTNLWKQYTVDVDDPQGYEIHQAFKKKLFDFCQCIKKPRTQEVQGHY